MMYQVFARKLRLGVDTFNKYSEMWKKNCYSAAMSPKKLPITTPNRKFLAKYAQSLPSEGYAPIVDPLHSRK